MNSKLNAKKYQGNKVKGTLYYIQETQTVSCEEVHKDDASFDKMILDFHVDDNSFGIYAEEYKTNLQKKEMKKPDILCGIETNDHISLEVIDMKRNLLSFTGKTDVNFVVNRILHYIEQMYAGYITMKQIIIASQKEEEMISFGLATRNWDDNKLKTVIQFLSEDIYEEFDTSIVGRKAQRGNLEKMEKIRILQNLLDKKIIIQKESYDVHLYLLKETNMKSYDYTKYISPKQCVVI